MFQNYTIKFIWVNVKNDIFGKNFDDQQSAAYHFIIGAKLTAVVYFG